MGNLLSAVTSGVDFSMYVEIRGFVRIDVYEGRFGIYIVCLYAIVEFLN